MTLERPDVEQHTVVENASADDVLWRAAGTLFQRRRFILIITFLAAVASVVIALLTPKWYAAEVRVLQPEGGLSIFGLVNQATGGLGGLLGGGGGYERYLAILTSRSVMESVVEHFDLIEVYEVEADTPSKAQFRAIEVLSKNVEFEVALDYNYLGVVAYDTDPERAAEMANFMVRRLNEENTRLTSESARQTRLVIEQRLNRATATLDSVRNELQAFQETHGIVELETQAQAMMESVASFKAEAAMLDVQYQALARQYGPDNPQVRAAREARNAARSTMSQAMGGNDELLPVAMRDLPALVNHYARLLQEQLIQKQILETVYPIYEQSLFQEQSAAEAVQVVDAAVPPVLAARPSRRLIVIGTTLSAFLLACAFALAHTWLWQNRGYLTRRLNEASRRTI